MSNKPYTTEEIKKNIQVMEDEGLPLTAPIEVTIKGIDGYFHIVHLGHFHAIPNMTIELELYPEVEGLSCEHLTLRKLAPVSPEVEGQEKRQ